MSKQRDVLPSRRRKSAAARLVVQLRAAGCVAELRAHADAAGGATT